jgi:hypothetical protein
VRGRPDPEKLAVVGPPIKGPDFGHNKKKVGRTGELRGGLEWHRQERTTHG